MLVPGLLPSLQQLISSSRPLIVGAEPVTPTGTILEIGQRLQGAVQGHVAESLFRVRLADQTFQLHLPPSIQVGDTIELQVVSLLPRPTFSLAASSNPLSTADQLSAAAKFFSAMSQQPPEKALLRAPQGSPLWLEPQPPEVPQLAVALKETLVQSGLFYESHQVQWLEGGRSTASLMQEPQNAPAQTANPASPPGTSPPGTSPPGTSGALPPNQTGGAGQVAANLPGTHSPVVPELSPHEAASQLGRLDATATASLTGSPAAHPAAALGVPEHLQDMVQQQLNALDTRQIVWQGEVWRDQEMQWEIREESPRPGASEADRQWFTEISLTLPNLGEVTATLRMNSAGINLSLTAGAEETREALGAGRAQLAGALAERGIALLSSAVTSPVAVLDGHS